jgi:hypothetical protein
MQNPYVQEQSRQHDLDMLTSLLASTAIDANPHSCFENALKLFLEPDIGPLWRHARFVEGWYVIDEQDEVIVNEHGWLELDGRIIDPTVVILLPPETPVYYFAGVTRSWEEIQLLTHKKQVWFPYVRNVGTYGTDGLGHPHYKAAHDAARQKSHTLSHATQPPKKETFMVAQDDLPQTDVQVYVVMLKEDE